MVIPRNNMNRKLLIPFLIIVPLTLLIIGFSFDRTKYGTDPESAYLFNGLNIAMGQTVGLYDHPGITVHMYDAAVMSVTHFLRFTGTDLQTDVLVNSEYYIEVLRKSFIVLNSLLLFMLGLVAFSVLKYIWLAFILQLTPFLSTTLVEQLSTKVSPEQLLFTSSLLLIILILKFYSSQNQENKWFAVLFGILGGFGLATKFTFLPLLIIPFVILKGNWNKVRFLVTIVPSFILFTLSAADSYKLMFKWFFSIASHTGTYGQGSEGIINPAEYVQSLIKICITNKAMIVALIASFVLLIVILVRTKRKKEPDENRETTYILALFLAFAGSILMVAKHYHSNHYLIPALSLIGLVLVFISLWFEGILKDKTKKFHTYSPPALVVIFIILAIINKPYLTIAYNGYRESNKSTDETMTRIEKDYPGYVKTYYYPGSFNKYAQLRWGNVYAKQFHTDTLMKLFPEGLFYDVRDNSFKLWESTIPPGEFLKRYGGHILLVGGPLKDDEVKMVEDGGLKLKKLFEGRIQVVYEVDTAQSALFQDVIHAGKTSRVMQSDFETLTDDKQWVVANGEQFCKNVSITTEKSRSGRYSVSMPVKDSYAMDYELRNIKPGQFYEVSIWRFGSNEEAALVVSAIDSDLFYTKSNSTLEKDAKGWSKIGMSFRVPAGFKETKLKIYLWNHSENPAWFDDFQLIQYK
jgi:hypothetical protein